MLCYLLAKLQNFVEVLLFTETEYYLVNGLHPHRTFAHIDHLVYLVSFEVALGQFLVLRFMQSKNRLDMVVYFEQRQNAFKGGNRFRRSDEANEKILIFAFMLLLVFRRMEQVVHRMHVVYFDLIDFEGEKHLLLFLVVVVEYLAACLLKPEIAFLV